VDNTIGGLEHSGQFLDYVRRLKIAGNRPENNTLLRLVRLAGGWWLVLIYCERKILLAGWWLLAGAELV
jgi:hypothetical protein